MWSKYGRVPFIAELHEDSNPYVKEIKLKDVIGTHPGEHHLRRDGEVMKSLIRIRKPYNIGPCLFVYVYISHIGIFKNYTGHWTKLFCWSFSNK